MRTATHRRQAAEVLPDKLAIQVDAAAGVDALKPQTHALSGPFRRHTHPAAYDGPIIGIDVFQRNPVPVAHRGRVLFRIVVEHLAGLSYRLPARLCTQAPDQVALGVTERPARHVPLAIQGYLPILAVRDRHKASRAEHSAAAILEGNLRRLVNRQLCCYELFAVNNHLSIPCIQ